MGHLCEEDANAALVGFHRLLHYMPRVERTEADAEKVLLVVEMRRKIFEAAHRSLIDAQLMSFLPNSITNAQIQETMDSFQVRLPRAAHRSPARSHTYTRLLSCPPLTHFLCSLQTPATLAVMFEAFLYGSFERKSLATAEWAVVFDKVYARAPRPLGIPTITPTHPDRSRVISEFISKVRSSTCCSLPLRVFSSSR